ncbi:hypothetical protein NL676_030589 [Syzygium grande]|nr:hypothetical protein NL676_030589 [Syzygium grande]
MGGEKELWTLEITMISAMDDVCLIVSLSGDQSKLKQSHPVHKHGSTNPWFGHTFVFPVDKAEAPSGYLKFKIEKANRTCLEKDVGEVDVPVRDLLVEAGPGDVKPKVLSYECPASEEAGRANYRLSSCKGAARLKFGCHVLAINPQGSAAVAVAAASGMCDGGISVAGISAGGISVSGISAARISIGEISAGAYPPGYMGISAQRYTQLWLSAACRISSSSGAACHIPATNARGSTVPSDGIYTERRTQLSTARIHESPVGVRVRSPTAACRQELHADGISAERRAHICLFSTSKHACPSRTRAHSPSAACRRELPGGVTSRVTADVILNWLYDLGNNE